MAILLSSQIAPNNQERVRCRSLQAKRCIGRDKTATGAESGGQVPLAAEDTLFDFFQSRTGNC